MILAALAAMLAAPPSAPAPAKPLFASEAPIRITIQAPFDSLMQNRERRDAVDSTVVDSSGLRLPAKVRLRGITRRTKEICDFAPLRIDFTAPPPATSEFSGQRRLKLVTHCRDRESFQQKTLLEYAAYKMYAALTPLSFGARLADISYLDANGRPIMTRKGFFIEDLDDVGARNAVPVPKVGQVIRVAELAPRAAARYALFQNLIGNHDWSMRASPPGEECCHNARLLGTLTPGGITPLPYDFDFSGFVGAPYAKPPDLLRISNVRQRQFRGYCAHQADTIAALGELAAARPRILAALAAVPGLDAPTRATATAYLDQGFRDGADPARAWPAMARTCLK